MKVPYLIFQGFRPFVLAAAGGLLAIASSLAQPRLEIHRPSETTYEFRWSGSATGFALEVANTLATPTDWQAVAQTPVLLNGMYSVPLPMETGSRFFRLRSTVIPLTTIASSSPANGESGVAVTRATSIRFSRLLFDDNTLSEEKIYAEHNGVRLPAIAELVDDGLPVTTVTLSFLSDLPAGALIRVIVNGSLLRDDRDRLVDADGNGSPGGVRVLEFETADDRPPDGDGDGIDDPTEVALGTNPAQWDTDNDGFSDGRERDAGTDPLSLDSRPGILLTEGPGTIGERMASFAAFGPFAVATDAMAADRKIFGRIEAILNPLSTPALVNEALDAVGARIVMLRSDTLFVSLALPPRPGAAYSASEIKGITEQLVMNSDVTPFLFASQSFAPRPLLIPGTNGSDATSSLRPQDQIRMPAAWNLLARTSTPPATPVRVLVPDFYSSATRHPQLRVQRFIHYNGEFGGTNGNHGFGVSSAIAANFDEFLPTGTFPTARDRPKDYLEILSLPIEGLSMPEIINELIHSIVNDQPDIVSTSFGFTKSSEYLSASRIHLAFEWQRRVRASGRQFLHITAAGNDNDKPGGPAYERMADFSAPWSLAAKRGNVEEMLLDATDLTPSEKDQLLGSLPTPTFDPLENVVIVGSIDSNGSKSLFSEPGEDVVTQGERLVLACTESFVNEIDTCDSTNWFKARGTSFAAPQVAGVAAYLLTQKLDLSPAQLRDALLNTRAGNVLDAYRAVLELDAGNPVVIG